VASAGGIFGVSKYIAVPLAAAVLGLVEGISAVVSRPTNNNGGTGGGANTR